MEKENSCSVLNKPRLIREIAKEIRSSWKNIGYAAKPYLDAMMYIEKVDDMYVYEKAGSVVTGFLTNATHWRGDIARRIKTELKEILNKE